jgi:hypothetical protein
LEKAFKLSVCKVIRHSTRSTLFRWPAESSYHSFSGSEYQQPPPNKPQLVLGRNLTVGEVVRHSRRPAMQRGAPEVLRRNHLPGCRLHQGRPPQENGPVALDNNCFVSHGGDICPPRGAAPEDERDLGDVAFGHLRLVVEDASEMVAVREDVRLAGQVRACEKKGG